MRRGEQSVVRCLLPGQFLVVLHIITLWKSLGGDRMGKSEGPCQLHWDQRLHKRLSVPVGGRVVGATNGLLGLNQTRAGH